MTWCEQLIQLRREGFELKTIGPSVVMQSKATGMVLSVVHVDQFSVLDKVQREALALEICGYLMKNTCIGGVKCQG